MATFKVTLINEAEGLNQTIDVDDDTYILDALLLPGWGLLHLRGQDYRWHR
jgi:hypothetical protein